MSEISGLKNINLLSKEQYNNISFPAIDELFAVSGSGFGFPSSRFENLTLGASGSEYTAPASGWYFLYKSAGAVNQYIILQNSSKPIQLHMWTPLSGGGCAGYVMAQKGDKVKINYTASGAVNFFRFIYAEGE